MYLLVHVIIKFSPAHDELYSTTLCDKVCHLSVPCDISMVFSGYSGFLHQITDSHDIAEIVLKVALNTITPIIPHYVLDIQERCRCSKI